MQNISSLDSLQVGQRVRISEVNSLELPSKFFEMGLLPGSIVEVKHRAPFNGPIGLFIHTSNILLAIRKSEAVHILVEK